jgi:hypothetical protein
MDDRRVARPGDGPGILLETEPLSFFHPTLAGESRPGPVQPASGRPLLEEEPALWVQVVSEAADS